MNAMAAEELLLPLSSRLARGNSARYSSSQCGDAGAARAGAAARSSKSATAFSATWTSRRPARPAARLSARARSRTRRLTRGGRRTRPPTGTWAPWSRSAMGEPRSSFLKLMRCKKDMASSMKSVSVVSSMASAMQAHWHWPSYAICCLRWSEQDAHAELQRSLTSTPGLMPARGAQSQRQLQSLCRYVLCGVLCRTYSALRVAVYAPGAGVASGAPSTTNSSAT